MALDDSVEKGLKLAELGLAILAAIFGIIYYSVGLKEKNKKILRRLFLSVGLAFGLLTIWLSIYFILIHHELTLVTLEHIAVAFMITGVIIISFIALSYRVLWDINRGFKQVTGSQATLETTQRELDLFKAQVAELQEQLKGTADELSITRDEAGRLKTQAESLQNELTTSEKALAARQEERDRLEAEANALQKDLTERRAEVDSAKTELIHLKKRCKPCVAIFLPRASTDQDSFWMEFAKYVALELQKRKYQPVLEYLEKDYVAEQQISCFRSFDWESVDGVIVSLVNEKVLPELSKTMDRLKGKRPPYVLHDFAPDAAQKHFVSLESAGNLVYVENEIGGKTAADIMLNYLAKQQSSSSYNLVIVPGSGLHPHSDARIAGFEKHIQKAYGACSIRRTSDGLWTYEGAVAAMQEFMNRIQGERSYHVHGVFACNDDMALGVEDFLLENSKRAAFKDTVIVGFDYAYLLRQLWQRRRSRLIVGTVDAMVKSQADDAVDLIINLIERRGGERTKNVTPEPKLRPA